MEDIIEETKYCLNCKVKPCSLKGCPLNNDIPAFIAQAKNGDFEEAFKILTKTTVLPAVCGKICPHYKQCMGSCVRGIKGNSVNIGEIEEYIGKVALEKGYSLVNEYTEISKEEYEENSKKKIAIVGSGPSGLTAAAFLRRKGFNVTIYEKYNELGGILRRGIPEFRLDKNVLDNTINKILDLGIETKYNQELGKNLSMKSLEENYDAIYIAIGANISTKMNVPGEELNGVFGGNELLEKNLHPDYKDKKVAIIGGGNVAMDCARTIKRKGAKEVVVIYRRAEEQMPAEKKEIEDAKNEGIEFLFQNNLVKILGNKKVEKIECIKTKLEIKEGETRAVPVNIENSNYEIDIDYVVMAVGSKADKEIIEESGVDINTKGYIKINEKYNTNNEKIFAGGDVVGQTATVAFAARDGRNAAERIEEYLKKRS